MPHLSPATPLRNGRLRLLSPLCASTTGQIWRALDTPTGKQRAVKAIPVENGGAEAVANEADAIARVEHPNVIAVSGAFVEAGHGFIVMELAACNLAVLVDVCGPLPLPIALRLTVELAGALSAAHAACVLHRDVKPHNVLIMADGAVKLADFGIAEVRARGHTTTRAGDLLGTLAYMAPEQRRQAAGLLPAADFYALAATFVFALTGRPPGDLFHPPEAAPLAALHPALPELIAEAAAYAPQRRIAHLRALEAQLQRLGLEVADPAVSSAALAGYARATSSLSAPELSPAAEPPPPAPLPAPPSAPLSAAWGAAPGPAPKTPADLRLDGRPTVGRPSALAWVGALAALGVGVAVGRRTAPPAEDPWAALPRCADAANRFVARSEPGPMETVAARIVDLDQDGLLDVLFSNQLSESLSVWWGEPGALPQIVTEFPVGRHHHAPAVVDLNGDGRLDLVVAQPSLHSLNLVLSDGPRSFGAPSTAFQSAAFQSPAPDAVAAADLDGDGNVELAAYHIGQPELLLRWGSEQGPRPHRSAATLPRGAAWVGADAAGLALWAADAEGLLRYAPRTASSAPTQTRYPTPGPPQAALSIGGDPRGVGLWTPGPNGARLFRLDLGSGALCGLGTIGAAAAPLVPLALGDLDQDGVMDVVAARTCSSCNSNQLFLRGER